MKITLGREYLNDLPYSETEYAYMEKDRGTHRTDWLDEKEELQGYLPYVNREPAEFESLSKVLQAKINYVYRSSLVKYITEVCEMTKDRPFYDAYLDVKIYRDPLQDNSFNIFCWVIVSCGEDSLDTVTRSRITGLFDEANYDQSTMNYSMDQNFNDFQNSFIVNEFEKEAAYSLIYSALEMDFGDTFYHRFIVDVEGVPEAYFEAIAPTHGGFKNKVTYKANSDDVKNLLEPLGPFNSLEELESESARSNILNRVGNLIGLYRNAFGLILLNKEVKGTMLLVDLFDQDIGCVDFFMRDASALLTNAIGGGFSTYQTVDDFISEVISTLDAVHDFENDWGEEDDEEDFDPCLTIEFDSNEIAADLDECSKFFQSDFRFNEEYFIKLLQDWKSFRMLSPWYVISQDLRNSLGVVKALKNEEFLLDPSFEYLLPKYVFDGKLLGDMDDI